MGKNNACADGGLLKVVDRSFKGLFYRLGVYIGDKAGYFIIIPVFISLLLGTGLQQFTYENDPEYLFAPVNGQAQAERKIVENLFPVNYSAFNPSRFAKLGRQARVIITAQDNGSLLRQEIWREMMGLDELVRGVKINYDQENFSFDTLCARWGVENDCYGNDILELEGLMEEIEAGNVTLAYPIMVNPHSLKAYTFPQLFGGLQVSNVSTVTSAKAVHLNYFLNSNSRKGDEKGALWESAVLDALDEADADWKFIKVDRFFGRTIAEELDRNTLSFIPYMLLTVPFMIAFGVVSCMTSDWVRSKPFLGGAGVIAANLGSLAAFGLLCYCGVPLINITIAAPFLLLGIGMDDMFVMLAAWRRTSVHDPVSKRMGETYAEAAVSITITSLTDMLSFLVGIASPFLAVQIFCIYTAAAVLFTYLMHIFFFGGVLALSGYHEAENRHSVFWWMKATPRSKIDQTTTSSLTRLLMTGGIDPSDPHNPLDHRDHGVMVFFRDKWASFLMQPVVKALVLILFAVYIGVACWGITKTEEGMELKKLARDDSYARKFYDSTDNFFREFPYRIQVVVTGDNLDYSNATVQDRIESLMKQLETTKHTKGASIYTESWLRSFLRLAEGFKTAGFELDIETERDFIKNLEQYYMGPSSPYSLDVKFDENRTKILASRFIIQTVKVYDPNDRATMVSDLRAIAEAQGPELNVTIFHPFFNFFDQYIVIRSTTIQCVCIAGIVMMAVSLIFIPNPLCSLWVAFSVVSIEAGVLGFLTLWNVNLDAVSMTNLIMCIGFSVDFSAHISYAYMAAKVDTAEERLRSCLYALGLPIVQGALSTVLGVSILFIAPSYVLTTFFKSVLLVMTIAAAHGLLLLPVLLSLFGPGSCQPRSVNKINSTTDTLDVVQTHRRRDKENVP